MCWSSSSKSFPLNKFFEFVIRRQKPYRQYFYGEGYAQRRTQEIRRKREKRRKAHPGRPPGREPAYAQHRRPGTQVHGRHRDDGALTRHTQNPRADDRAVANHRPCAPEFLPAQTRLRPDPLCPV